MKLKKLSAVLIILILIMPLSVFGANDKITVRVSGEKVIFDVEPEIIDGRTMVPVRAIFEAMGASVSWDEASGTVFAEKLGKTVEFKIGEKEADYSGKKSHHGRSGHDYGRQNIGSGALFGGGNGL